MVLSDINEADESSDKGATGESKFQTGRVMNKSELGEYFDSRSLPLIPRQV